MVEMNAHQPRQSMFNQVQGINMTNQLAVLSDNFFEPVNTNELELLFQTYETNLKNIQQVSQLLATRDLSYFFDAHNVKTDNYKADVFAYEPAKQFLDASYWSKAFQATDIIENMPAKRREEWHDQIRDRNTPEFTKQAVYDTLSQHLASRNRYLAERIDGLFQALSKAHVTNQPQGFFKRIILADVYNDYGGVEWQKKNIIHDLRVIANKFQGRKEIVGTQAILEACRRATGEWVEIDGGLLRMKAFIKGTCHIELHEKVAWELNQGLHFLYPAAIPSMQQKRKADKKPKAFEYLSRFINPATLERIAEMQWSGTNLRVSARHNVNHQVDEVLQSLGGIKGTFSYAGFSRGQVHTGIQYSFSYHAREVVDSVVAGGQLPDKVSYQYYPTPTDLGAAAAKMLGADESHKCLEPSAGQGGLIQHMPKNTKALEISALHCEILKAQGYDVEQGDFLAHKGEYDRILMNPPFSEGRAKAHVLHAIGLLAKGGKLVAIAPSSHRGYFDKQGFRVTYSDDIKNAFADASVTVILVTIEKE